MARQRRQAAVTGLVLFVASAVIVACGGAGEREPEPDRVVNVVLRCATPIRTDSNWIDAPDGSSQKLDYVVPGQERSGEYCRRFLQPGASELYLSHYGVQQEVTVRTGSGGSYTIEISPLVSVAVGEVWPQEER